MDVFITKCNTLIKIFSIDDEYQTSYGEVGSGFFCLSWIQYKNQVFSRIRTYPDIIDKCYHYTNNV